VANNKRDAIIRAAQEIITEIGFNECTISEIARRANVFDSIIYRNFKNKEDLLFYSLKDIVEKTQKELMLHFSGIMGAGAKLSKMVWFHLHLNDHKSGDTRMLKNLLFECRSNPNFYLHEAYQTIRKYTGVLIPILQEGIDSSIFRSDFKPQIVRDMIFGFIDQESISCLLSKEVDKTIPDFELVMSLIFSMILNGGGKSLPEDSNDKASRIINSATRIFSIKGYAKATMLEIANDAKVAEGTLYEYFKTKDDLIFSISAERFKKEKERMERFFESDDPLTKLQRLIQYHFTRFFLSAPYSAVFFDNILKMQKNFYTSKAFVHFLDYISILDEILEKGKKTGVFRADVDNRVFRNLYFGAFSHLTIKWFVLGKSKPNEIVEEFSQTEALLCRAVTRRLDLNGSFGILQTENRPA
jgi:AcrR family transcriptional regulator